MVIGAAAALRRLAEERVVGVGYHRGRARCHGRTGAGLGAVPVPQPGGAVLGLPWGGTVTIGHVGVPAVVYHAAGGGRVQRRRAGGGGRSEEWRGAPAAVHQILPAQHAGRGSGEQRGGWGGGGGAADRGGEARRGGGGAAPRPVITSRVDLRPLRQFLLAALTVKAILEEGGKGTRGLVVLSNFQCLNSSSLPLIIIITIITIGCFIFPVYRRGKPSTQRAFP